MNTAFVETTVEPTDRLELTGRVREELTDLMQIDRYSWDERGTLTLRGQLSGPADALYRAIRTRMERLGFTPFLRHDAAGGDGRHVGGGGDIPSGEYAGGYRLPHA